MPSKLTNYKILVLIAVMTISISAFSQNYKQAVGIKIGSISAIEYKLNTSIKNSIHLGLHLPWNASGVYFSGYYNWNYAIKPVLGLSWYLGPGANIGMDFSPNLTHLYLSINAMVGMEYKFQNIPLALAVEFTPGVGISPSYHLAWNIGLGIRYTL